MRRRRSKLGGRSVQCLIRLLKEGKLDGLTNGEIAKVVGNDPFTADMFMPWVDKSAVSGKAIEALVWHDRGNLDSFTNWQLETVDPEFWVKLLKSEPELIRKMPWNSLNLSHLIAAGLGECCKMQDLSGEMWSRIINRNPACIEYCDLSKLSEEDWMAIYKVREQCIDALRKRVEKIRKMYPWLR